ncbi:RNA-directed DNA polymerase, eukaryota, reverse transcriptase zinc-binding domain protein [Tanacetum coccineum]
MGTTIRASLQLIVFKEPTPPGSDSDEADSGCGGGAAGADNDNGDNGKGDHVLSSDGNKRMFDNNDNEDKKVQANTDLDCNTPKSPMLKSRMFNDKSSVDANDEFEHVNSIEGLTFVVWLAIQDRLTTQDKLRRWGDYAVNRCSLRCQESEDINHLLFQYAGNGSNIRSVIKMIAFASSIYHIWQERNGRMFKEVKRNCDEVFKNIMDKAKNKLLGLTVKDSSAVREIKRKWAISCKNINLNKLQVSLCGYRLAFGNGSGLGGCDGGKIRMTCFNAQHGNVIAATKILRNATTCIFFNKEIEKSFLLTFLIHMVGEILQDHTGLTWVTDFQEAGEEVLGCSTKELYLKSQVHDDERFSNADKSHLFAEFGHFSASHYSWLWFAMERSPVNSASLSMLPWPKPTIWPSDASSEVLAKEKGSGLAQLFVITSITGVRLCSMSTIEEKLNSTGGTHSLLEEMKLLKEMQDHYGFNWPICLAQPSGPEDSRTTTTEEEDQELDGEDDEKAGDGIAYVDSKEYNEPVSKKRKTLYDYVLPKRQQGGGSEGKVKNVPLAEEIVLPLL